MINQTFPQWLRAEWKKMADLPPKKRWEHFWTYYKIHTFLILVGIALLAVFLSARVEANKDVIISGVFINTDTSEEGYAYLSDGYWQHRGGQNDQRVNLIQMLLIQFSGDGINMESAERVMQLDALIAAQDLDYMILDERALEFYGSQELCLDLTQVLTQEQLNDLEGKRVTVFGQEQQKDYWAAIDISDSAFAETFGFVEKPVYFVVVCNGQNLENIPDFLEHLLSAGSLS